MHVAKWAVDASHFCASDGMAELIELAKVLERSDNRMIWLLELWPVPQDLTHNVDQMFPWKKRCISMSPSSYHVS